MELSKLYETFPFIMKIEKKWNLIHLNTIDEDFKPDKMKIEILKINRNDEYFTLYQKKKQINKVNNDEMIKILKVSFILDNKTLKTYFNLTIENIKSMKIREKFIILSSILYSINNTLIHEKNYFSKPHLIINNFEEILVSEDSEFFYFLEHNNKLYKAYLKNKVFPHNYFYTTLEFNEVEVEEESSKSTIIFCGFINDIVENNIYDQQSLIADIKKRFSWKNDVFLKNLNMYLNNTLHSSGAYDKVENINNLFR